MPAPALAYIAGMSDDDRSWFVLSLARGLDVIRAFRADASSLSVSEVAARAGVSRAAARRLLMTLRELGYVGMRDDRWTLRPRVLELGYAWISSRRVEELVQPYLDEVAERTGQSSSLGVLEGREIVFVARAPAPRRMSVRVSVGSHLAAHATAIGKVLLAALPEEELARLLDEAPLRGFTPATITGSAALRREIAAVREAGFATAHGELDPEVASIAVPVRGPRGEVLAAINVSTHASAATREELPARFRPLLEETARSLRLASLG